MPTVRKQQRKGVKRATRKQGVMDRIQPLEVEDMGIHVCIYGRSGTGKTTFWSTFPKPILAMICSGGKGSGELRSIAVEDREGIDQVIINDSSEVLEVAQQVDGRYKTLILDHLSYFQDMVLAELLGLDEIPEQKSWGLANQSTYGQVAVQVKTSLRTLLDLSINVVIIAQERDFSKEDEGEDSIIQPFVAPAVSPSIVGWLLPACSYVLQTYLRRKVIQKKLKVAGKEKVKEVDTGEVEYCLRTYPNPVYASKVRVPRGKSLPECLVNPTYGDLLKLIN